MLYRDLLSSPALLLLFLYIFLKAFINAVFFDVKDMEGDYRKKLKTIPLVLGKKNTYLFLNILNLVAFAILIAGVQVQVLPSAGLFLSLFVLYSAWYLYTGFRADERQIFQYTYIFVDGETVLWPVVVFLGKMMLAVF